MFSVPLIVQSPQLSPLPVGTEHCQSGTYFQRGQHCFIGYLGSACPINGVFISPFSCQCRTSQSDSVNIKNAFFFPLHSLSPSQNNIWNFSLPHKEGRQIKTGKSYTSVSRALHGSAFIQVSHMYLPKQPCWEERKSPSRRQQSVKPFPLQNNLKKDYQKNNRNKADTKV